jgi:saccharopine dehydrogenase-like NADP-dependent oxidoreductase
LFVSHKRYCFAAICAAQTAFLRLFSFWAIKTLSLRLNTDNVMVKIFIPGAGKSATSLIQYLLQHAEQYDWHICVGDLDQSLAQRKTQGHARAEAVYFNVKEEALCDRYVSNCDVVASVLPADFHYILALACLKYGKHIVTPSYVSAREWALHNDFKQAGLLFMGEIGLDPGIDHLSIMKMLHDIAQQGGKPTALRSFCGALIAPESDNNPWHYKFTWAPMNVILAGQGTAQFLENGKPRYVPYNRLFSTLDRYEVANYGAFEGYANRDSMPYIERYGVQGIDTFVRGTLRREGYCAAWNIFVQLGLTDNTLQLNHCTQLTYTDLLLSFLPASTKGNTPRERLANFVHLPPHDAAIERIAWLGFFDGEPIRLEQGTPAQLLADLLQRKWQLQSGDKDMIVMLHQIDYEIAAQKHSLVSSMVLTGNDEEDTAIARTVGLPMAIMVKLVANRQINLSGVQVPLMPEVYNPILDELAQYGISFEEKSW